MSSNESVGCCYFAYYHAKHNCELIMKYLTNEIYVIHTVLD